MQLRAVLVALVLLAVADGAALPHRARHKRRAFCNNDVMYDGSEWHCGNGIVSHMASMGLSMLTFESDLINQCCANHDYDIDCRMTRAEADDKFDNCLNQNQRVIADRRRCKVQQNFPLGRTNGPGRPEKAILEHVSGNFFTRFIARPVMVLCVKNFAQPLITDFKREDDAGVNSTSTSFELIEPEQSLQHASIWEDSFTLRHEN